MMPAAAIDKGGFGRPTCRTLLAAKSSGVARCRSFEQISQVINDGLSVDAVATVQVVDRKLNGEIRSRRAQRRHRGVVTRSAGSN
jgi:hypothetical protein